jgi:hypothetical protein
VKRIVILILLLAILSTSAYFLIRNDNKNTKGEVTADRGFTVESIDDVQKIVIKHTKLQPLVFTREGKQWKLNGKYAVDDAVFVNVEKVVTGMKMLFIPSKAATPTIMESIKKSGIQVDVYEDDSQPSRIFFIGSDTQKGDGTYMLLGGSSQPYAMHLPGLGGGLRSRFEQPLENFRDKFIFRDRPQDIEYVKVEYPKQNSSSFIIENKASSWSLKPLLTTGLPITIPESKQLLTKYMDGFERLGAEKLLNDYPLKDSVIFKVPNCIIELKKKDGSVRTHKFFAYDDFEAGSGNSRSPTEIKAQNRMFVLVDDRDFYTVQNRVFGDLFRGYQEFFGKASQVKIKN